MAEKTSFRPRGLKTLRKAHDYPIHCDRCGTKAPCRVVKLVDAYEALEAEYESLGACLDDDLTFKDLEMKIRDGSVHIHAMGSEEGGAPQYRIVAAILWNLLLDKENELPPNYRCVEWTIKPGGSFEGVRLVGEIVRPGGKSSHEIRKELEARLETVDV